MWLAVSIHLCLFSIVPASPRTAARAIRQIPPMTPRRARPTHCAGIRSGGLCQRLLLLLQRSSTSLESTVLLGHLHLSRISNRVVASPAAGCRHVSFAVDRNCYLERERGGRRLCEASPRHRQNR